MTAATATATKVPDSLKDKVNPVKNRVLFLSPSVLSGEEREARKEDFESLSSSNIGSGGFGKVYKVKHRVSGNIYAIKVINKAKILESDMAEQMKLEVKIMYKLDHPNIIKLYNHFEDDESFYLVLELASKGQLYTKLKKQSRLEERVAAQYIRDVVAAVGYLHSLNPPIIHRDIKPENILLDDNEVGKLCDFGWSNFFNQDRKRMTYCGTPEYLAPEMIKQAGHDKSLDLWNIGVLTFELLTGRPPFEGSTQSELYDNISKVKINYPKDFPKLAKDLISRLLKADPRERITEKDLAEHAWFRSNPPLRSPTKKPAGMAATPDGEMKYEIISKKSLLTSPKKQPEIKKELPRMVKKKDEKDKTLEELSNKYQAASRELAEAKIALQMKSKEVEAAKKENVGIKEQLGNAGKGVVPESMMEMRKLAEEVQKLKMLNKNRIEVLSELDKKNLLISEQETKMKLLMNEIEIEKNAKDMAATKTAEWQEKVDSLEKKYETLKTTHEEQQKEKGIKEAELEGKLEIMQKKINSKAAAAECDIDDTEAMMEVIKSILDEIKGKIKVHINDKKEEENVRLELVTTYAKLAGAKSRHDNDICDLSLLYGKKLEELKDASRIEQGSILKSREAAIQGIAAQLKELQDKASDKELAVDRIKSLETMVELQKRLITDMKAEIDMQQREEEDLQGKIRAMKEKIGDLEYQYNATKDKGAKAKMDQPAPVHKLPKPNIYI